MKDKSIKTLRMIGLGFLEPLIRLFSGEEPSKNGKLFFTKALLPLLSIILFVVIWHAGATALYNSEASVRIEKARAEQGDTRKPRQGPRRLVSLTPTPSRNEDLRPRLR